MTDFLTASNFYSRGHIYFASATTMLIFAPFIAILIMVLLDKVLTKRNLSLITTQTGLVDVLWNVPFMLPLR